MMSPWIFDRVLNVRLHSILYDFMCIKMERRKALQTSDLAELGYGKP